MLKIIPFGSSHSKYVGVIIKGFPAGIKISKNDIQKELNRRKPGQSILTSNRKEKDEIEILEGIKNNQTTGKTIKMRVKNVDIDISAYKEIQRKPRPGSSDLGSYYKYRKIFSGGGKFSGRMTITYVAAGALAKKLLKNIEIIAYTKQIGKISCQKDIFKLIKEKGVKGVKKIIESNPVRTIGKIRQMERAILKVKSEGDSLGGIVEIICLNVPIGLGDPFDRLDAALAYALMAIPGVKAVEIGAGLNSVKMKGSENNDPIILKNKKIELETNNCGGILGGVSIGMPIIARIAVKPTSSIAKKQKTIDLEKMKPTEISIKGRHDPCLCSRIVPVAEAMIVIVLAKYILNL